MGRRPLIFQECGPVAVENNCSFDTPELYRSFWQQAFSGVALGFDWVQRELPNTYAVLGQLSSFVDGIDFDGENRHPG